MKTSLLLSIYRKNTVEELNRCFESIKNQKNISNFRYTVDKLEDLQLVKEIIKNISTRPIFLQDIIKLNKDKPDIFEINKNIKHDGYLSSIEKDEQYFKSKKNYRT